MQDPRRFCKSLGLIFGTSVGHLLLLENLLNVGDATQFSGTDYIDSLPLLAAESPEGLAAFMDFNTRLIGQIPKNASVASLVSSIHHWKEYMGGEKNDLTEDQRKLLVFALVRKYNLRNHFFLLKISNVIFRIT